jgi:hypothetical protein
MCYKQACEVLNAQGWYSRLKPALSLLSSLRRRTTCYIWTWKNSEPPLRGTGPDIYREASLPYTQGDVTLQPSGTG